MSEHKQGHDPESDPPGAVSDQNREENQSGHRPDQTHPEPRTSGKESAERESPDPKTGAAGEGSQSTGHRQNAG
jgi:hypothetical protein